MELRKQCHKVCRFSIHFGSRRDKGSEITRGQVRSKVFRIRTGESEAAESRGIPEWIEVDTKALKGKFKNLPARADMSNTINESLIIELYSK